MIEEELDGCVSEGGGKGCARECQWEGVQVRVKGVLRESGRGV